MNKILYWSPFTSKVATVKSVINSVDAVNRYLKEKYKAMIIDAVDEWKDYKEELKGIICEEYPALFVLKDARIIILRDLYNQVFKSLNISVKTVAIFREAEKSAKSMCDMVSISMPSALACVNYYQNYLRSLKDSESILKIKLEDIIKSTEELKKITDFLGCKYDKSVDSLFKKSLIHHK